MSNFLSVRFFFLGMCILTLFQDATLNTSSCNTPQLGPKDKLEITIFDNAYAAGKFLWTNLCDAIKKFPKGLITMKYKAGALARGSVDNIQCGSGDCKLDQFYSCMMLSYENMEDCFAETEQDMASLGATIYCYCNQDTNKDLLDNAKLREEWKVPENVIPALTFNKAYDPCAKTDSAEDIKNYICQVYQNKVGGNTCS